MGEEQPAPSGAEPVPSAVVPQRAVLRPFTLRPLNLRPFVLRPLILRPAVRRPVPPDERARRSAYCDPVTWATAVAVFGAYAAISLFRLMQLNPSSWDLGIYTEYVKQYARSERADRGHQGARLQPAR